MSADNYLTIERNGKGWSVFDGCASTDWKKPRDEIFNTRDEAIDEAQNIQSSEMIEYGLMYIEPISPANKGESNDG